jgi:hypothetical protein
MQTISAEVATKTWEKMCSVTPEEAAKMMDKLNQEQPAILAFLMASGEDILTKKEQELQVYLGVVIWQIMLEGNPELTTVPIETIELIEEMNINSLNNMENASSDKINREAENIFHNFKQQEVFRLIMEIVMKEADGLITEENKGIMFFNLKTVIECFDR